MADHDDLGLFKELFSRGETPKSSLEAAPPEPPPPQIPGYEILNLLGRGGMGNVYRARQLSLDRVVAVKLLNAELSGDPEYVGRFLVEARTAGKLRHLNVVGAIDCGSVKEMRFMVMEFIEGKPLDVTLKERGILNERVALQIIKQVAEGLDYAWRHGIIHRDIKPQNIMMTPDGTAKICDLGLCKSVRRDLKLTSTGYINCTPTHASPEQARADKSLDCRTDIYSLGITFYQLVTGVLPFEGASPADFFVKHATAPRVPPQERNPRVSPAVGDLILRMIDPDPSRRPSTPGHVVEEIRSILSAKPLPKASVEREPDRKQAGSVLDEFPGASRAASTPWDIQVSHREPYAIVRLAGRLDDSFDREITRKLTRLVEKGVAGIVVDLGALEYMSSRGVSAFIAIVDDVREKGGDLKLAAGRPQAKLVLERLGITLIIQHLATVEQAVEAFRSAPVVEVPAEVEAEAEIPLPSSAPAPVAESLPPPPPARKSPTPPAVNRSLSIKRDAPTRPNRKLFAFLAGLAAFSIFGYVVSSLLFSKGPREEGYLESRKDSAADSTTGGSSPAAAPLRNAGPDELERQLEELRRFAASSEDYSAILARCAHLRSKELPAGAREEVDAIEARAKTLAGFMADRALLAIQQLITIDVDFRRKDEILSMIAAASRSFGVQDPRIRGLEQQYRVSLRAAALDARQKALQAKAERAPIANLLVAYAEAARLAEDGVERQEIQAELEAFEVQARKGLPGELQGLRAELQRLVAADAPAAFRLAENAVFRYSFREWVEPVREETNAIYLKCRQMQQDLLREARLARDRGDDSGFAALRARLASWEISGFLGEFDRVFGTRPGFLGVETGLERPESPGLPIVRVVAGGAAARAGILAGDVVLQLDGRAVSSLKELKAIIGQRAAGDKIRVKIRREATESELDCVLGVAPEK